MIQLAKKISWAEQKLAWICGKNISKTRWWPWQKRWNAWKILIRVEHLVSQCVVASLCRRSGFRHRWRKVFAKYVGTEPAGKASALPGSMGRGAFTQIIKLLECPGEIWATQRAFLLPHQEGVSGSYEGSAVQALCLCGNAQGVCSDWFAPDGSRS